MEVSSLTYSGAGGLQGRSPLLRLQSDERLVNLIRRGNGAAFELLVKRYEARLLAFCRHMLGSREDAEDVLQEVMASAYSAILADQRPINVRPWLYRIARNRSLNHLRRQQPIGVDSMDIHLSEHGASAADKVHARETFRMLVSDIQDLPETQRTALVLRELDALSYEQIAEAMETTIPSIKSLLVRARISLAEASEARLLSCEEVRIELAEVAEGLRKRPPAPVRRHVKSCPRCAAFRSQIKRNNRVLAALLPLGPLALLRKLVLVGVGHSAGSGAAGATGAGAAGAGAGAVGAAGAGATATGAAGATAAGAAGATAAGAAGATAAGAGAAGAGSAIAGAATAAFASSSTGLLTAGVGALATKAAAGLAAAALVTAGAVEATGVHRHRRQPSVTPSAQVARSVDAGVSEARSLGSGAAAASGGLIPSTHIHAAQVAGSTAAATTTAAGTASAASVTPVTTATATSSTTTEPTVTAPVPAPPVSGNNSVASAGAGAGSPGATTTTPSTTTSTPGATTTTPTTTAPATTTTSTATTPTTSTTASGTTPTSSGATAQTTTPAAGG